MRKIVIIASMLIGAPVWGQESVTANNEAGQVELGTRSTISLFDDQTYPGLGYGGQFRIRASKKLNTEWYADYIKTDIGGLGTRETIHIGWSVMFYPFASESKKGSVTPYLIAGHCFDHAKVSANITGGVEFPKKERWTTAVQLGIGANYYLSDQINLSLSTQYMYHIGNDLHVEEVKAGVESDEHAAHDHDYLLIEDGHDGAVLEGHLLTTLSLNVRIFDFINKK